MRGATRTWEQALQAAAAIPDAGRRPSALLSIAESQANAGDVRAGARTRELALQAAAAIATAASKVQALSEIAVAQAIAGDAENAARTREQALQAIDTIFGASGKAGALRALAAAQVAARDTAGASRSFDQAFANAVKGEAHVLTRAAAIALIAADRAEAGDAPGARAWAVTHASDPTIKVGVLVGIAVGLMQPTGNLASRRMEGLVPKFTLSEEWK